MDKKITYCSTCTGNIKLMEEFLDSLYKKLEKLYEDRYLKSKFSDTVQELRLKREIEWFEQKLERHNRLIFEIENLYREIDERYQK